MTSGTYHKRPKPASHPKPPSIISTSPTPVSNSNLTATMLVFCSAAYCYLAATALVSFTILPKGWPIRRIRVILLFGCKWFFGDKPTQLHRMSQLWGLAAVILSARLNHEVNIVMFLVFEPVAYSPASCPPNPNRWHLPSPHLWQSKVALNLQSILDERCPFCVGNYKATCV